MTAKRWDEDPEAAATDSIRQGEDERILDTLLADQTRRGPILTWETDERGERYPVYTEEQAQRIARAAWGVHFLLPHPDDVRPEWQAGLREFHRAIQGLPPLKG